MDVVVDLVFVLLEELEDDLLLGKQVGVAFLSRGVAVNHLKLLQAGDLRIEFAPQADIAWLACQPGDGVSHHRSAP